MSGAIVLSVAGAKNVLRGYRKCCRKRPEELTAWAALNQNITPTPA